MAAHTNVCVIGLGSMGMGAARACLQAGLNTWGVDINPDNCRALLAAGAKEREPQRSAIRRGTGCSCAAGGQCRPGAGDPVRREQPRRHLKTRHRRDGVVHHRLRRCSGHCRGAGGVPANDARRAGIGRRREKAAAGDMTVMASGSDAAFARLAPVLDAVAGKVYRIGSDIGLGSTVKNYPSAAGRGAHRRCRRSDGACRPRRDPTGDDV